MRQRARLPCVSEGDPDLIAILLDANGAPEVRGHAAEALAHSYQRQFSRLRPVPPDLRHAVRTSVGDADDVVRYEALWALAQIGGVRDIALLERALAAERARAIPSAKIIEEAETGISALAARRRKPR